MYFNVKKSLVIQDQMIVLFSIAADELPEVTDLFLDSCD